MRSLIGVQLGSLAYKVKFEILNIKVVGIGNSFQFSVYIKVYQYFLNVSQLDTPNEDFLRKF